jgi:hypothetical protein
MTARAIRVGASMALAAASIAPASFAQSTDPVASEALFQEGNRFFDAGNFEEACPKLAESYRLEPGTGTLLKLALCHERQGKLASAWTELTEAQGRSKREGDAQRERYARERVAALQPRLSTLLIRVAPEVAATEGLELARDGVVLGQSSWNLRLPIDGGEHSIVATAPGKQPYRRSVRIANEAEAAEVMVAELLDIKEQPPPEQQPPSEQPRPPEQQPPPMIESDGAVERDSGNAWGGLEWAGVATAGAGVVALGLGGYFLADALGKNGEETGAEAQGNRASLCGVAGGVLVITGATLFIVGRAGDATAVTGEPKPSIGLAFTATPHSWAAVVRGIL